jgi:DNA polymerase-1
MAMKMIRGALFPRVDHQIMEIDHSQLEVRIAACYHLDPTMIEYIETDHDMHKDIAIQIFKLKEFKPELHEKVLRKAAKNGFVFPQFYGDYYKNNAKTIGVEWCKLPQTKWTKGQGVLVGEDHISDLLIDVGIRSYDAFTNHLKSVEDDFWGNRFMVYDQWKERWWKEYQKKGYFVSKTGFLYRGVMSRNDATNYPVQGSAFHVLLWALIEAVKNKFKQYNFRTKIIGQIHDSLVFDVFPPERENVIEVMKKIMEQEVRKAMSWIIVPLHADVEICPVNESWSTKKKYQP